MVDGSWRVIAECRVRALCEEEEEEELRQAGQADTQEQQRDGGRRGEGTMGEEVIMAEAEAEADDVRALHSANGAANS